MPVSVRHALLALLSHGPLHGAGLREAFESRTGTLWELNVGQVYTTLQRLERDGLVIETASGDGARRDYALTDEGHRELGEWLTTPPSTEPPPRDELVIKVLVALDVHGADVNEVLQAHRQQLVEAMQVYTRMKISAEPGDQALLLAVDAQLFRLEAMVRWLDTAGERLRGRRAGERSAPRGAPDREVVR